MKKLVVITGGAGFIGSHTADALHRKEYRVRIVDNLQSEVHGGKWPAYLHPVYERMKADVREKATWQKALRGASYVYHLAAYQDQRLDFSKFFTTNTVSTALLYETIVEKNLPIQKVVLASSQFVYGDGEYVCAHAGAKIRFYPELRPLSQLKAKKWHILCPHGKGATHVPFHEDQPVTPTNSYGLSKYALEMTALRLGATYNIPSTALRYSIVQGPRQSPRNIYSGALRIFVSQALAGVPITVYEDGLATRDFVNIEDVVAANLLALTKKTDFQVFNVGGGKAYTVLGFAQDVKRITRSQSKILIPGTFRRTDTRHAVSDISKLKKFGWRPRFTTKDSIAAYAAWFKEADFMKEIDRTGLLKLKEGIAR